MTKLVLIDGNAIMHRAYHAMPPLTTPQGEPIGAVQGFVNILYKILNDLNPTHLAVCFDRKEKTFRHEKYDKYQSHRPTTEDNLASQFSKIQKLLKSAGIEVYDKAGYEADDLIGTLAKQARKSKLDEVLIVTGDKDQMQLIDEKIKIYFPVKGLSKTQIFGAKDVEEKLGVPPEQVIDLKALTGDPSDNYPGVHGIGPKTAIGLIKEFGSYPNIYKNIKQIPEKTRSKLISGKSSGDISYELAKIITDCDFDFDFQAMKNWDLANDEAYAIYEEFGMRSFPKRLAKLVSDSPDYKQTLNIKDIVEVAKKLKKYLKGNWAIRGTASLVLQDLDFIADDVDIICDRDTALSINKIFTNVLINKVTHQRSKKFDSYFGEFNFDGVKVEIMGEWRIRSSKDGKKIWSKKFVPNEESITLANVEGLEIPVTKIDTELEMFAAMGRWNAYHKIKKLAMNKFQQYLFE